MDAGAAGGHRAGWYARTCSAPRQWPVLNFDLDVDVCVIGGGLAGLTAAREVARRGWSVALLEAHRIAWNASGSNCGFVLPGYGQRIDRIVERCGLDHAKRLWALSEEGADYVRAAIRETGMAGVDPVGGWLDVSKVDNGDEMLPLISLLGQEFGAEVEGWPAERVREVLRSDRYFHAIHFPKAFHIHPLNYALGLAAAADEAGARLFEETRAIEIDPAGVRKRVTTPAARVRANHVVLAGNTHLGSLAPQLAQTLVPVSTFVAVTAPLGDQLAEAVTYRGGVSDSQAADYHYRIVGGDRLMWAGGAAAWNADARRYGGWLGRAITRIYPQLTGVEIADVWSGVMGFAVHRMPQIGEVSPGLWIASGFAGHGLNTSALAGLLIARALVEQDDTWHAFLPYDLVWAGGAPGRAAFQIGYWTRRWRDDVAAQVARRREARRRRDDTERPPQAAARRPARRSVHNGNISG